MATKQKLVILGGGFAGLTLVKHIDKRQYDVTLIDRNNYHSFPPLFYQVASSGLDPTSISFPLRLEVRKAMREGTRFHMGNVTSIDVAAKTVTTSSGVIDYDKLVLALGTTNNFFGNDELLFDVYTLKSIDESIRCRNEILDRCERAAVARNPEERKRLLSFVVIGGGPAGVEIAGAIGEIKRYILQRDYPEISPDEMSITILEGTDRLLRTMREEASAAALDGLEKLMVNVRLNTLMENCKDNVVHLKGGGEIYSEMVIWTAGVTAVPFNIVGAPNFQRGPGGRFATDEHCAVTGLKDIYALGDMNYMPSADYPRGLPQLAQVAIQQGRYLAKALNKGSFDKPFKYVDKGSMATIGRNKAVADIGKVHLKGFGAWMAWMFIHLISLLGMRSKINVLLNWVWSYFTFNTSLRLLLRGAKYPRRGTLWDRG